MYHPMELARFALSEFERGLHGLSDEDARVRLAKRDGTQMNAIAWIVAHVAQHWLGVRSLATGQPRPSGLARYGSGSADPTPPPLAEALGLLREARASLDWLAGADEALLGASREEQLKTRLSPTLLALGLHQENVGTALLRAVLHTWFHAGEINAIRQMLGHPEIFFVGRLVGQLEWRPVPRAF